jgi:Bacterial DNA polymerase III alpha subunit finger domain
VTGFDVDIDIPSHVNKNKYGIKAIQYIPQKKILKQHNSGHYYNSDIPIDKFTGNAAIDYKEAEKCGFIKIDLLTNTSYDMFSSKKQLLENLYKEPDWNLLSDKKFVEKLPHISKHFDIINDLKPKSIEDLSDILALIRPGKEHLLNNYKKNKHITRINLYRKPKNKESYYFKKSHAIATASMIVCIINRKNSGGLIEF